jgi:hypothetical protein
MAEAPADRAAIADRHVRDMRNGHGGERLRPAYARIGLEHAMARHGAHPQRVPRLEGNAREFGNPIEIDEQRRRSQAEVEHRYKALSAGKQLRVRIRLDERERLVEGGRCAILEGGGFHVVANQPVLMRPPAARRSTA